MAGKMKIKIDLDENTRIVLTAGIIALVTILISSQVVRARTRAAEGIRLDAAEEARRLSIRKTIAKIDSLSKEYSSYLYDSSDTFALRDTISTLARRSNVDIVSMQPLPQGKMGSFAKTSFKARLRCEYDQLGNFIAAIESLPKLIWIEEFTITGGDASEAVGMATRDRKRDIPVRKERIAEVSLVVSVYVSES